MEYYLLKYNKLEFLKFIQHNQLNKKPIFKYGIPNNEIIDHLKMSSKNEDKLDIIMNAHEETFKINFGDIMLNQPSKIFIERINSISSLDFLFKNYSNQLFPNNNNNWQYIKDIKILEHLENLMVHYDRVFSFGNYSLVSNEILERALNKPELYIYDGIATVLDLASCLSDSLYTKLMESNYYKKIIVNNKSFLQDLPSSRLKFYRFVYNGLITRIEDIQYTDKCKYICEINIRVPGGDLILQISQYQIVEMLYFNNRLDDIFKIPNLNISFASAIVCNYSVSSSYIEKLFEYSIQNEVDLDIYSILDSIISSGNLSIIKFLNLNYSYLFSKSTRAVEGVLDFRQLKNLVIKAISNDYVQIVEILLVYANLTRNEYDKINVLPYSLTDSQLSYKFKDPKKK